MDEWEMIGAMRFFLRMHGKFFSDKYLYEFRDVKRQYGEERSIALGTIPLLIQQEVVIIVFFTLRLNRIRIISAQKANKKERSVYEENREAFIRLRTA